MNWLKRQIAKVSGIRVAWAEDVSFVYEGEVEGKQRYKLDFVVAYKSYASRSDIDGVRNQVIEIVNSCNEFKTISVSERAA